MAQNLKHINYSIESRKTFASRDVVFHEQVQEGKDDIGDDWHIPLLMDESSEDEREQEQKEEQKEEQEEGDNASPVIAEENKFEFDVKSAFLNGDLKEEIYLVHPEGFVKQGREHLVCRLKKALYGLKQAPRSWYEKVDSFFLEYGFHRSLNDPNLYTMYNNQGQIILISLYVDDMIITGDADNLIRGIKKLMAQVFEMKDLGSLHYCLGLEVCRNTGQTFLTQWKYDRNLLEKFGMDQCRSAAIPLQHNLKLSSDDDTKEVDATMYRQLVGSLIYLTTTRPDLAYSVSVLSQFMSKPLESFSDSDWVGNLDDRRSITGYTFSIGSEVIAWSNKKQSTVALSSCEAEYQAFVQRRVKRSG
eukprot:PITA_34822